MSSELLAGIAGIVLTLLFSYLPGLRNWYDPLPEAKKKLIMLAALFLSAAGVFALACVGRYDMVVCSVDGAWELGRYFILALVANQSAYSLSPKV